MLHLATRHEPGTTPRHTTRTIAVGYVDSEEGREALRTAYNLAHRVGARLRVLTVVRPIVGTYAGIEAAVPAVLGTDMEDVQGEQQLRLDRELRELLASFVGNVEVDVETFVGDPAETLIAVSEHVDLLVCGSRGHGPVRRIVLGSVSGRVSSSAHCPVIVLPRGVTGALERLTADL